MPQLQRLPAFLPLLLALLGAPALAATYTVTNTNDSGVGSLRQAMLDALATAADDEIVFDPSANGIITLAAPLPTLETATGALQISGNGAAETVISGVLQHGIFSTEAQDDIHLRLSGMTLRDGGNRTVDWTEGGAILFNGTGASSLTIDAVEFVNNYAWTGGAVLTRAPAVIRNSTFEGNGARVLGTAMFIDNTSVMAENLTVSGNSSSGALVHVGGPAGTGSFHHLSLVNNTAAVGLGAYDGARFTLVNSIVANNTPSGFDLEVRTGGTADTVNSVHNVIGDMNGIGLADGVDGNRIGVTSPFVGPLGHYGGPTRTVPLLPGSPALDAGTTGAGLPATDQRGVDRVGAPDIGAFESRGFVLSATSGGGQAAYVSTAFAGPLLMEVAANAPIEPVEGGGVVFSAPSSGASAGLAPATATLGSDGRAQTTSTANATVGTYNVTATSGALLATFALTNKAAAGIVVTPTSGLATTEAGGTATFTVVLNSAPDATVTVPLASNDTTEGAVSPTSLSFTAANWNVAQTVTVTGVDDALLDGAVAYGITVGPSTSSDAHYNGLSGPTVAVSNADNDVTIGGTVVGLGGAGLVLQNNGVGNLPVSASGSFTFAAPVAQGSAYSVTVLTQPLGRTCTVVNGSGTASAHVTNVQVTCAAAYTLGGSVTGLTGTGLVLRNGGESLPVSANGPFAFTQTMPDGGSYDVTVATQPGGQRCTVANASGSNVSADVNDVQVACVPYFEGTTVPASGPGGTGSATFTGGGPGCRFDLGATGFEAAPTTPLPGRTLPQGVLRVKLVGCTAAVAMEVTWPEPVDGYTKHGLAASTDTQPSYFAPAGLTISGRTARFTLTDGQQGDDDWTPNGEIADPSGPTALAGAPGAAQPIPTLGEWGVALLSALLGVLALRRRM